MSSRRHTRPPTRRTARCLRRRSDRGTPGDLRTDPESVAACVGGAASVPELESMLTAAGFVDVSVEPKAESCEFVDKWDPDRDLSNYVVSTTITGKKPASGG